MEAIECIKTRRSVREFKPCNVEKAVMNEIIETARFAPSWKNSQTARYIVIQDETLKNAIAEQAVIGFDHNTQIIKNCPTLVVVTCIHGRSGFERDGSYSTSKEDRWEVFDAGLATQTFCLAAHAKGVASVIMGIFSEDKVKELADIPQDQVVCALVAVGYAEGETKPVKRKETDDLVVYR